MTQKEKQILLRDLCTRVPYGVMVHFEGWNPEKLSEVDLNTNVYNGMGGLPLPYLRSMSNMTEEEKAEYTSYCFEQPFLQKDKTPNLGSVPMCIDWLNAHHFDYRGLIEKGLALEAPEGMYD